MRGEWEVTTGPRERVKLMEMYKARAEITGSWIVALIERSVDDNYDILTYIYISATGYPMEPESYRVSKDKDVVGTFMEDWKLSGLPELMKSPLHTRMNSHD